MTPIISKPYEAPKAVCKLLGIQLPCAISTGESFDPATIYSNGWEED